MKQFVKALNVKSDCFKYISSVFLGLSYDKIKNGVFDGPKIRKIMNDSQFTNSMTDKEKRA